MPTHSLYQSFRRKVVHAPFAVPQEMAGKTVIVTGASLGSIGFETARVLVSWGAHVVITARSDVASLVQALRRAAGEQARVDGFPLELTDAESVTAFVVWFKQTHGERLDVLINNAGIHLDLLSQWTEPHLSPDGYEIQWRTNYLGTMQFTHLLLPLLQKTGKKTGDARIVNVVSQLHSKGFNAGLFDHYPYNSWTAYGMSKLALVHATFELQRRFAETDHVQAYCLHPGSVFTNIADKGLAGNRVLQTVRNVLAPMERFSLLTAEEGAQTSIHCATHPDVKGGQYYQQCRTRTPSADCHDAAVSERLWRQTQAWFNAVL